MKWMGAIRIIFERLATTKRVNARSANSQSHVKRDEATPDCPRFLRRSVHLYGTYSQCEVPVRRALAAVVQKALAACEPAALTCDGWKREHRACSQWLRDSVIRA